MVGSTNGAIACVVRRRAAPAATAVACAEDERLPTNGRENLLPLGGGTLLREHRVRAPITGGAPVVVRGAVAGNLVGSIRRAEGGSAGSRGTEDDLVGANAQLIAVVGGTRAL